MPHGSSWTSMPIAGPGGARVELDGVDCLGADDCVLVGGFVSSDPGRPGRLNTLRAVHCVSSLSCVAVGTARGSSNASLVYRWDGAS